LKIVAVTACPAGIAHTYIAAESLERAARNRGIWIKVETQGAMGIENEISLEEARSADVVVFAADMALRKIERFEGLPVVETGVAEAIRNPNKVLDMALAKAQEARQ